MTGFIYFIRCAEFVKIGFSKKPNVRTARLATANPHDLLIAAVLPGSFADEAGLHKLLCEHHHRREWFRWHPDIEQIIKHGIPHFDVVMTPLRQPPPDGSPQATLKNFRKQCDPPLNQTELGKMLGVDRVTIARWETGKRKIDTKNLPAISQLTGIAPKDLRPDLADIFSTVEAAE